MTVQDVTSLITHTGNGATTEWPYDFIIPAAEHARVGLFDIPNNVLTPLDINDYNITGIGAPEGGSVTYPISGTPIDNTKRIAIWREVPYTQDTDLTDQLPYYPTVLEAQLDRIVMQIQQLDEATSRTVKVPIGADAGDLDVLISGVIALSPITGELQTLTGIAPQIISVDAISADVTSVAAIATQVVAVASNEVNINAVAANATNINTVSANNADITTVAGISGQVSTVAGIDTDVTAVAGIKTDVQAVAGALPILVNTATVLGAVVRHDEAQTLTPAQQGQARANIGADLLSGFRNKIINGELGLWQRGTGPFFLSGYAADRWFIQDNGGGWSFSRTGNLGYDDWPNAAAIGTLYYDGLGTTPPKFSQAIEDVRTLAGRKITFGIRCRAAQSGLTLGLRVIQYFGLGGSAGVEVLPLTAIGSIPSSGTAEMLLFTVDLPSVSGKTFGSSHFLGIEFRPMENVPMNFDWSEVLVVEGDATAEADPFSPRHVQQELALCQRYFRRLNLYNSLTATAAGQLIFVATHFANMRIKPNVTEMANSSTNVASYDIGGASNEFQLYAFTTTLAAGQANFEILLALDAEL